MGVLTFLSDFGSQSPYPGAMRAVASGIAPSSVRFLDLTHEIRPQHVREGAFVLASVAPECPDGSVHCAVVDPGVGTEREGIVVVTQSQFFVGPDNGLLMPAAVATGPIRAMHAIDLSRTAYLRTPISQTFHGRDVFAPVAAHLAAGVAPSAIGPEIEDAIPLDLGLRGGDFDPHNLVFHGRIVYVDRFGNLITNLPTGDVDAARGDVGTFRLSANGRDWPLERVPSFGHAERGDLCLTGGSHGLIEIAVREGNAQARLNVDIGSEIRLTLS